MEDRLTRTSELARWLCQTMGAVSPREAIASRCAELISALGDRQPPVRTAALGALLGLEPGPLARAQIHRGILDLDEAQIYVSSFQTLHPDGPLDLEHGDISVQERGNRFRPLTRAERTRMRFTVAHELGHTLFYNFATRPGRRVAPPDTEGEEEDLCDFAALHFLLPAAWIEPEFKAHPRPNLQLVHFCASKYLVSPRVIVDRAAEWYAPRLAPDEFYLLSQRTTNVAGGGVRRPRCLGVILPAHLRAEGVSFLAGHQGLSHARPSDSRKGNWSLVRLHADLKRRESWAQSGPHVETLHCPDGCVVRLNSKHFRLGETTIIWTKGRIEVVAQPMRGRKAA